ncbi:hypothetical protein NUH88_12575 [Nisaea acidiphila]|uniref:Uncharacterized protein n=1 Tax=Nisaea acidiphila TaxID=1862145 RepID=A0A9J7AMS0_9PROT|nr:hypothetical protein [Nisaea acidiphila]UUX48250.1 hypothetical protein NUH88_12575 [Nisaea acidiphila]
MTSFPPHGEATVTFDDRLIHIFASGSTNIEQIEMVGSAIDDYLDHLNGRPCGALIELGEEAMLTQEAGDRAVEFISGQIPRGLCAVCYVIHTREFRETVIAGVREIYDRLPVAWTFADNADEAISWLSGRIGQVEALAQASD